ncbi:pyridoxal phosphate-dependent enzyme, beta subunit, partial [Aureobasidium melanogenum]
MSTTPPSRTIIDAIGNTPCVELSNITSSTSARILLKLESLNPTGSYKDRMAISVLEAAEKRKTLKPGMTVVEATGGSTGSSLAFVCAVKGYDFTVVSSDAYAQEKLNTMAAFGANVVIVQSQGGKVTPDLVPRMRERAKQIASPASGELAGNFYYVDQFSNRDVLDGYAAMGKELLEQIPEGIDAFCGAVGGAGMLMGVSKVLKTQQSKDCHIVALEPASSPIITKGYGGQHSVEGIGIGFLPTILDSKLYDEALAIEESEARSMARRLAKEEGILAGTSTGLNVVAALKLAERLGPGKVVVTVACDSGLKYVRGNLFTDG